MRVLKLKYYWKSPAYIQGKPADINDDDFEHIYP